MATWINSSKPHHLYYLFMNLQWQKADIRQMTKSRRNLRQEDSRPPSDEDSEEEPRGRKGASAATPSAAATPA